MKAHLFRRLRSSTGFAAVCLSISAAAVSTVQADALFTPTDITSIVMTGTARVVSGVGLSLNYETTQRQADNNLQTNDYGWSSPSWFPHRITGPHPSSGYHSTRYDHDIVIHIDMSAYTNAPYARAYFSWPVTLSERYQYSPPAPVYEADLGRNLAPGSSLVLQESFAVAEWPLKEDYQAYNFLGWGWDADNARVYIDIQNYDYQSDPIRPDHALAATVDPINTINGAVTIDETDVYIPAVSIPLEFSRAYNSALASTGTLGGRWTHSLDWRVEERSTTFDNVTSTWKVVRTGLGEEFSFKRVGTNTYESSVDANYSLSALTNGSLRLDQSGGVAYHFASNGILDKIEDSWGNRIQFAYTNIGGGDAVSVAAHSAGQALSFSYSNSLLTRVDTPSSNFYLVYSYNPDGELTNVARHVSGQIQNTSYAYCSVTNPEPHLVTQRVNSAGHTFAYTYEADGAGGLTRRGVGVVATSSFYEHAVDFDEAQSHRTTVTYERDDTQQLLEYEYHPVLKRILGIAGPHADGASNSVRRTWAYNDRGDATNTFTLDASGTAWHTQSTAFDGHHNVTDSTFSFGTDDSGEAWTATWSTNLLLPTSMTDPEGARVEFDYTNGQIKTVKLVASSNATYDTTYTYTSSGQVASVTDANGHTAGFEYDSNGFLEKSTPALGPETTFKVNDLGILEELEMPGAEGPRTTTLDVNELGWVRSLTDPAGGTETFDYNAAGYVLTNIDRGGRTTTFDWHPTRKLKSVTRHLSGTNVTVEIDYDQQFNVRKIVDPLDRPVETYAIDIEDRVVGVTNLEGQTMSLNYAIGDWLGSATRFDGTDVAFAYDIGGRLAAETYPNVANVYTYYRNGLLATAVNEAGSLSNVYNTVNRIVLQSGTAPSGNVTYAYWPAGQVSNMTSVAGPTTYTIDAADRIDTIAGPHGDFTYAHNEYNGLVSGVTFDNGVAASYEFNDLDQLTAITWSNASGLVLKSFAYGFNDALMITNIVRETGERLTYAYDDLDRLTGEKTVNARGEVLSDIGYSYDLAGNRLAKTRPGMTIAYSLEPGNNRLSGWTLGGTNLQTRIDIAGFADEPIGTDDRFGQLWVSNDVTRTPMYAGTNFWSYEHPSSAGTQTVAVAIRDQAGNVGYATNTYTISIVTNAAYAFDSAGCLTNLAYGGGAFVSFSWNDRYQLVSATRDGATVETYTYDALGQRVSIAAGGTTNWMVYAGPHVVADVDAAGSLLRSYTYGPGIDNILAMRDHATGKAYYYLTDHLGTVHAITDEAGEIVEQYRYDAWGRVRAFNSLGQPLDGTEIGNRYTFQGREYSWETGMYYFRARWYDPITGRWLSKDPIGIAGGLNQYAAFGNNPVNFVDPFGLSWWKGIKSGLIGVGVGIFVGAAIAATAPAWAVVALGVTASAVGGFMTGVNTVEYATGRTYISQRELSWDERTTRGGQILVDTASLGIAGTRWFRRGASSDADWIRTSPARQRMRSSMDKISTSDDLAGNPGIRIRDWRPQNLPKIWNSGADSGLRYTFPYVLSGAALSGSATDACSDN